MKTLAALAVVSVVFSGCYTTEVYTERSYRYQPAYCATETYYSPPPVVYYRPEPVYYRPAPVAYCPPPARPVYVAPAPGRAPHRDSYRHDIVHYQDSRRAPNVPAQHWQRPVQPAQNFPAVATMPRVNQPVMAPVPALQPAPANASAPTDPRDGRRRRQP